jgi:hypothetical protein
VCHRPHLKAFGGSGYDYDYLLEHFLPSPYSAGGDVAIHCMTVLNPPRLLSGA